MTHKEQIVGFAISLALLTAGLTWLFGAYGLIGPGVVLLLLTLLVNEREDD